MSTFRAPMINLYSRDLPRAVAFYSELGFVETSRTPASGKLAHVELKLDGLALKRAAGADEARRWWIEAPRFILHSATGRTPT